MNMMITSDKSDEIRGTMNTNNDNDYNSNNDKHDIISSTTINTDCTRYDNNKKSTDYDDDIDEMKMMTMYKMVTDCVVIAQGKEVVKKILYLNNKQSSLINSDNIDRIIQELDIGDPKFIIKLIDSVGISNLMKKSRPDMALEPRTLYGKTYYNSSEINDNDEAVIETHLILFMKTCILPLAMQTKALILVSGSSDCYLSTALAKVAISEQARLGKNCPFTVLATAAEKEVHCKAFDTDTSMARQIANGTKAWQNRISIMDENYKQLKEDLGHCDLTEAAERYIIFEGYDEKTNSVVKNPDKHFESIFLTHLARDLPCIAVQCLYPERRVPFLADIVHRNIPLLLIDTTERAFTTLKLRNNKEKTTLAGLYDAFKLLSKEESNSLLSKWKESINTNHNEAREKLVDYAIEIEKQKMEVLISHGVCDMMKSSQLAFFHSVLNFGHDFESSMKLDSELSDYDFIPLYKKIEDLEKAEKDGHVDKTEMKLTLVTKIMNFLFKEYHIFDFNAQLARCNNFLDKAEDISRNKMLKELSPDKWDEIIKGANTYRVELNKRVNDNKSSIHIDARKWVAIYDILTSPRTFSTSIFETEAIKRILKKVAKIDRLPLFNSLEALRTIQDGWDYVEAYGDSAKTYKLISKLTYVMLLSAGILISFFSIVDANTDYDAKGPVIALSFLSTIIAAYVAFVNPAVKWQQLRAAQLSIESIIWTFRTRAGPFRSTGAEFDRSDDILLDDTIKGIKSKVLEGADIKASSFYSTKKTVSRHFQHPKSSKDHQHMAFGALDNFVRVHPDVVKIKKKKQKVKDKENQCKNDEENQRKEDERHLDQEQKAKKVEADALKMKRRFKKEKSFNLMDCLNKFLSPDQDIESAETSKKVLSSLTKRFKYKSEKKGIDYFEDYADTEDIPLNCVLQRVIETFGGNNDDDQYIDNHYDPLTPDAFILFRILPAIEFYKDRIPVSYSTRYIAQALLVGGTILNALLGFSNLSNWAAGITIITSGISAYMEFNGVNAKISRYSSTVYSLHDLVHWWQTLPQIDKSAIHNIDHLIISCEELLQREVTAWRSTSQSIKMLQKASSSPSSSSSSSDKKDQ